MKGGRYLVMFAFLAIFLTMIHSTSAQEVQVGVYVLNLGKFDVGTGSFTADFYLDMKCSENCSTQSFEFMNGRASSTDLMIDTPQEKFYRIQANLVSPVDLKRFPFDTQHMQIILEDKQNTKDLVYYVPMNQSAIDKSIAFTGWNIDGWNETVRDHYYPVYNQTYSQYVYDVQISRIALNSFMKTFLPVIFIMLIVIFSFMINPEQIGTKLTLAGSSLVASVMFHVAIQSQLPPVGYLTFADKFMVLTYLVLLYTFLVSITMLRYQERKNTLMVNKIYHATEHTIFFIVPFLYLLLFWIFL